MKMRVLLLLTVVAGVVLAQNMPTDPATDPPAPTDPPTDPPAPTDPPTAPPTDPDVTSAPAPTPKPKGTNGARDNKAARGGAPKQRPTRKGAAKTDAQRATDDAKKAAQRATQEQRRIDEANRRCERDMVESPRCILDVATYRTRTANDPDFTPPDCSAWQDFLPTDPPAAPRRLQSASAGGAAQDPNAQDDPKGKGGSGPKGKGKGSGGGSSRADGSGQGNGGQGGKGKGSGGKGAGQAGGQGNQDNQAASQNNQDPSGSQGGPDGSGKPASKTKKPRGHWMSTPNQPKQPDNTSAPRNQDNRNRGSQRPNAGAWARRKAEMADKLACKEAGTGCRLHKKQMDKRDRDMAIANGDSPWECRWDAKAAKHDDKVQNRGPGAGGPQAKPGSSPDPAMGQNPGPNAAP